MSAFAESYAVPALVLEPTQGALLVRHRVVGSTIALPRRSLVRIRREES
ncbi:hypothetical protein ACSBPH_08290 [Microbacterium sp. F51-2R]